jgi:cytochrome c biogenesis protein CcdA
MIDLKWRRLVRNLLLVAVLVATAIVLTACEVNFYELGRVAGEIAREITDWLKQFLKGFSSGFGGPFCSTPTSLMIIGLAVVWYSRRKT